MPQYVLVKKLRSNQNFLTKIKTFCKNKFAKKLF